MGNVQTIRAEAGRIAGELVSIGGRANQIAEGGKVEGQIVDVSTGVGLAVNSCN